MDQELDVGDARESSEAGHVELDPVTPDRYRRIPRMGEKLGFRDLEARQIHNLLFFHFIKRQDPLEKRDRIFIHRLLPPLSPVFLS
jgi:hypothetical protein